MSALEAAIAQFFPDEYSAQTWPDLLPRFIAMHMEIYDDRIKNYEQELTNWQQTDQSTAEPPYPIYPVVFAQACEDQAKREGLPYIALAVSLYLGQAQARQHKKQLEDIHALCCRYELLSESLQEQVKDLEAKQHEVQLSFDCDRRLN